MAEEPYHVDYETLLRPMREQNERNHQEQRLLNIENQLRQQDWDRNNRYYERLREGNDRYGKGK